MRRVLVTGAGGFVGRHLLRRLAERNHVVAVARQWEDDTDSFGQNTALIAGDLTQADWLNRIPEKVDTVVHLAAMTQLQRAEACPAEALAANCLATIRLLEFAKGSKVNLFVYCSTGGVYESQRAPLAETATVRPATMYGFTKYLGEQVANRYTDLFPVVILRLFHPYGAGQDAQKLIPRLVSHIRQGRPIVIHAEGRPVLSFIYVDDLVEVLVRSLRLRESAVLNVAGPQAASVWELSELIGTMLGVPPTYHFDAERIENEVADTQNLQSILRYSPRTPLNEGLSKCLAAGSGRAHDDTRTA